MVIVSAGARPGVIDKVAASQDRNAREQAGSALGAAVADEPDIDLALVVGPLLGPAQSAHELLKQPRVGGGVLESGQNITGGKRKGQ